MRGRHTGFTCTNSTTGGAGSTDSTGISWPLGPRAGPRQERYVAQKRGSPRASRAWPLAWPSPSGPSGRQRSPGSTARRRRVARSAMRSTVDAGGAAPYLARHSGHSVCDSLPGGRTPGARWDGRTAFAGAAPGRYGGDRMRPGAEGAEHGSSSRRRASARRARRKLPPCDGAAPGDPGR